MRQRKTRQWMRHQFVRMYGCLPNGTGTAMMRIALATDIACVHSSRERPLTLSIIHARINVRGTEPAGFMLACRRQNRIG